jgi:ABC-2 type transport system permease protein
MTAQLRSELRKMRTTRTNLGLLLGLIAIILLAVLADGLTSGSLGQLDSQKQLFGNGTAAAIFAALIGIMAVTSEFRHGTIRATFVFTPVRSRVVAAKVLASLIVGIAFGVLAQALTFGVGYAVLRGRGIEVLLGADDIRLLVLGTLGMSALWAALGVGIGAVVRNQVLAIVGVSVWAFLVETLLYQLLPGVGRYTPGAASSAMTGDTSGTASLHLLTATAGTLLLAAYASLFVLIGTLVTSRRDVD